MDIKLFSDEYFMKEALKEAQMAFIKDEVPVGAVIVLDNRIIARAHNLTETLTDVTAHAEMQAFTSASNTLGGKYLDQCTLFVTLEPCIMCTGAASWAQIGQIKYGASDPKKGFTSIIQDIIHPKTKISSGIMAEECSVLLKEFFQKKRKN